MLERIGSTHLHSLHVGERIDGLNGAAASCHALQRQNDRTRLQKAARVGQRCRQGSGHSLVHHRSQRPIDGAEQLVLFDDLHRCVQPPHLELLSLTDHPDVVQVAL